MTEEKIRRLEDFILPLLKCIVCNSTNLKLQNSHIQCLDCQSKYLVHQGIPIMLKEPKKALEFSSSVVAENPYSEQWIKLIENANGFPVLDIGSGNTPDRFGNLVKLDIFALPNADVVGYAEHLPFRENAFQAVFAGAVFEHIEKPWIASQNILRILRPGGQVYVETAFLQPVHAYPNHYFNMTKSGIESIFCDFEKIKSGIPEHHYPSFTLRWILETWCNKLAEDKRRDFLNTTIGEIINEYTQNVFSKRWLEGFNPRDVEELACGVAFYGQKPVFAETAQSDLEILDSSIFFGIRHPHQPKKTSLWILPSRALLYFRQGGFSYLWQGVKNYTYWLWSSKIRKIFFAQHIMK